MKRYIYWLFAAPIGLLVLLFALSNRAEIDLLLWPLPFELVGVPIFAPIMLAFVGGFSVVFALYGVSVGYLGALVADYRRPIEIVGGVFVILMWLALLGFAQRLVGREARVGLPARPTTRLS